MPLRPVPNLNLSENCDESAEYGAGDSHNCSPYVVWDFCTQGDQNDKAAESAKENIRIKLKELTSPLERICIKDIMYNKENFESSPKIDDKPCFKRKRELSNLLDNMITNGFSDVPKVSISKKKCSEINEQFEGKNFETNCDDKFAFNDINIKKFKTSSPLTFDHYKKPADVHLSDAFSKNFSKENFINKSLIKNNKNLGSESNIETKTNKVEKINHRDSNSLKLINIFGDNDLSTFFKDTFTPSAEPPPPPPSNDLKIKKISEVKPSQTKLASKAKFKQKIEISAGTKPSSSKVLLPSKKDEFAPKAKLDNFKLSEKETTKTDALKNDNTSIDDSKPKYKSILENDMDLFLNDFEFEEQLNKSLSQPIKKNSKDCEMFDDGLFENNNIEELDDMMNEIDIIATQSIKKSDDFKETLVLFDATSSVVSHNRSKPSSAEVERRRLAALQKLKSRSMPSKFSSFPSKATKK